MAHSKHIFAVVVGIILLSLQSCTAYKEVEMLGVESYNLDNVQKEYVDLAITIKVNNPNNYNIKIKKTSLDLFLEKKKVGKAKMKENIILKKQTNDEYTFVVQANYKELSNSVFSSLGNVLFKNSIKLGVKGKVKAKAFGIVGKKFDLNIEENISMKDLKAMIK